LCRRLEISGRILGRLRQEDGEFEATLRMAQKAKERKERREGERGRIQILEVTLLEMTNTSERERILFPRSAAPVQMSASNLAILCHPGWKPGVLLDSPLSLISNQIVNLRHVISALYPTLVPPF
jgi:hypothetical protein